MSSAICFKCGRIFRVPNQEMDCPHNTLFLSDEKHIHVFRDGSVSIGEKKMEPKFKVGDRVQFGSNPPFTVTESVYRYCDPSKARWYSEDELSKVENKFVPMLPSRIRIGDLIKFSSIGLLRVVNRLGVERGCLFFSCTIEGLGCTASPGTFSFPVDEYLTVKERGDEE